MLYVFETISEKKRAFVYGLAKGVGTLGSVLVLVIKLFFVIDGKGLSWNIVLYLIAGFGLATLLIAILFLRESDPFVKQKIKELEIPLEEREKKRIEAKNSKFGLVNSLKLCFKNKQLRYLFISLLLVSVANNMINGKANTIMIQKGHPFYILQLL